MIDRSEAINSFAESWQMIEQLFEDYAKSVGFSAQSLETLEVLYAHPEGYTQKQIAADTHASKQVTNLVIKDFWKKGLVELHEIPEDRRLKLVQLTEDGKRIAADIIAPLWEDEVNGLMAIDQEKLPVFLEGFKQYAEYINYKSVTQEKLRGETGFAQTED